MMSKQTARRLTLTTFRLSAILELMNSQTATIETKYFSGHIELRGAYPVKRAIVRALFPEGKIKKYDDFSLWVGTLDGKWSESSFLPVTRIIRFNSQGSNHKCDGRCRNAKRGDCECSCKGQNHGSSN